MSSLHYSFNTYVAPSGKELLPYLKSRINAKGKPQSIQVYNTGADVSSYTTLPLLDILLNKH